jgi:hypothetical protein
MDEASWLRVDRRGLLSSTAAATWRSPVEVQRGIRVRDQSASSPSWLTVVGSGTDGPVSRPEQTSSVTHLRPAASAFCILGTTTNLEGPYVKVHFQLEIKYG